jgi:Glyoxalase-like domain
MSQAVSLDHIGIVGRDLHALAATFQRLGFTLTPLARHAGGRTGNRCVMLRGAYLELMSTIDGGTSATLDRFLARYEGAHILAFGVTDPDAARARLIRAGLDAPPPSLTDRLVDDAEPDGPRARFALVTPPDIPEGRMHLVHHLTPEALWQDRFMHHANGAADLLGVTIQSAEPAVTTARLSRIAGVAAVPDPDGGYAIPVGAARVRIAPADGRAPTVPCIRRITVRTADANRAIRHALATIGCVPATHGNSIIVPIGEALHLHFTTGA